jgi:aryl-alcohol dehydrogenase-like predicted oxidoreductase
MNNKISRLGLGTVQFGCDYGFTKAKTQGEVNHILNKCLELGINFLDTARSYGDSEEKIGNFLKKNKSASFFIATKLDKINRLDTENRKSLQKFILNSVDNSIRSLGIKKIDLLQLHQEERCVLLNDYFWEIIGRLKRRGLITSFGVSVYDVDTFGELINFKSEHIDFVQVPYNILDRRFEKFFKDIRFNGIRIISRSVFLRGILTCSDEKVPEKLREINIYKGKIKEIAQESKFSVAELCLLFALSNKNIMTTLIGVNSAKELLNNVSILGKENKFKRTTINRLREIRVAEMDLLDPRIW